MSTVDEATRKMLDNLIKRTGKSLEEWVQIVKDSKLTKHADILNFLKNEHGFGHGFATVIVDASFDRASQDAESDDLVVTQYGGTRSGLRPLYDALIAAIRGFGKDVEVLPRKDYVSLRRKKQFAIIQPTADHLDVGINLKKVAPSKRLEASGSFSLQVSHRVRITKEEDVDKELVGWLRQAYDGA
jgi:predicted transport protein